MEQPRVASWPELVRLMVEGDGQEPTMTGVVEHVPGEHHEAAVRYWVRRDATRIRLDGLDGSPRAILGDIYVWTFDDDEGPLPVRGEARPAEPGFDGTTLLIRPSSGDFDGDDFTKPTGPARSVTRLDRPAWEVELAPPSHKPSPMQVVIDAATGMLLEQRNDAFGYADRWVELTWAEEFPPDVFTWSGEYVDRSEIHARWAARDEEDFARRRQRASYPTSD